MPRMSGREAFLELLRSEGVEVLFGNPGTTELPLMDALVGYGGIRYFLALQEAAAMAMADGYVQASGRLAAVNFHVAPGLGNAMGMLYNASRAGAPILVIGGQQHQSFQLMEPLLWWDLPRLAEPLVKWAYEVRRLADLPTALRRAAKAALSPPTGPVFLSLPADVMLAEEDLTLGSPTRLAPRPRADAEALRKAAELLVGAKSPTIVAGSGVSRSDALEELARVAEALGARVLGESLSSSVDFPPEHPLYQGELGRVAPAVRSGLEGTDVLFVVGAEVFALSLPSEVSPLPPGVKLIHLSLVGWEIGKNFPAEVALLGDPKATLAELLPLLRERSTEERRRAARERAEAHRRSRERQLSAVREEARARRSRRPMDPLAFVAALGEALPPGSVVVDESLTSGRELRRFLPVGDGRSYYRHKGGGIGWGFSAAVGVELALPGRRVVGLTGDGSALYTIQALWTAAHYRIPVVFAICNNGGYRILKQRVLDLKGKSEKTGEFVGMDIRDPEVDFVALAGSFGVRGERISSPEEVAPALARALAGAEPVLLDVVLSRAIGDD